MESDQIGKSADGKTRLPGKFANAVMFAETVCGLELIARDRILRPVRVILDEDPGGKIDFMSRALPVKIGIDQIASADGIEVIDRAGLLEKWLRETRPAAVLDESRHVIEAPRTETEPV